MHNNKHLHTPDVFLHSLQERNVPMRCSLCPRPYLLHHKKEGKKKVSNTYNHNRDRIASSTCSYATRLSPETGWHQAHVHMRQGFHQRQDGIKHLFICDKAFTRDRMASSTCSYATRLSTETGWHQAHVHMRQGFHQNTEWSVGIDLYGCEGVCMWQRAPWRSDAT